MNRYCFPERNRFVGKRFRGLILENRVHNVVFNQRVVIRRKNIAQNQNRVFDARFPKLNGFRNSRHAERITADFRKRARNRHGTVSVGVGFDNCHDFGVGTDFFHSVLNVLTNCVEVDLGIYPLRQHFLFVPFIRFREAVQW